MINMDLKNYVIEDLVKKIKKFSKYYYQGEGLISDSEFDNLINELEERDPNNDYFNKIGTDNIIGTKIKHHSPMYSMNKVKDLNSLLGWINSIGENKDSLLCCEPKIDGLACNLTYSPEGELLSVATRGNGEIGSIIKNHNMIKNIPSAINIVSNNKFEIRGELYIPSDYSNKQFPNSPSRNVCSGLINRMVHSDEIDEKMGFIKFLPYWIENSPIEYKSIMEMNIILSKWFDESVKRFSILISLNPKNKKYVYISDLLKKYEEYHKFNNVWEFDNDGLVFILNDVTKYEKINKTKGHNKHHRHYQMAFKFPSEQKTTKVMNIEYDISRNGRLIPIAILEPVIINKTKITRATLNNFMFLNDLKLSPGDLIIVEKANEIIPKIVKVLKKSGKMYFKIPFICPSCNKELKVKTTLNGEGRDIVCNNYNCPRRKFKKLSYWIKSNNIEYLGDITLQKYFDNNILESPEDLYTDNFINFLIKEGQMGKKIANSIDKNRIIDEYQFLSRLGIPGLGSLSLKKLRIKSFEEFMNKYSEDSVSHTSIIEENITEWLKVPENYKFINNLYNILKPFKPLTNKYNKKVTLFCITGTFKDKKRQDVIKEYEKKGWIFSPRVTNKVSTLICGEGFENNSKYKKAKKLNIKISHIE